MQRIFEWLMIALFYIFRVFKIRGNKIVVSSYLGKGYGDNPKYIAERLLEDNKGVDIVWLAKDTTESFPKGIRVVNYRSIRAVYELSTAKTWIDNRRKPPFVRKRKNQFYIMTWHSNIALKKVEKDVESKLEKEYVVAAKRDSKMADVILSGSKWETECMRRSFWYDGKILEIGYPRQDPFVNRSSDIYKRIRKQYSLPTDAKLLLYAPTFRSTKNVESLKCYSIDWEKALAALKVRFGGEWFGMIRLHPNITSLSGKLDIPEGIIDVSLYNDMQELIVGCDCLITDYSSTIIEAAIANKLGLVYAVDYEDYKNDRDVYFDIKDDLPFPFADNNEQLCNNILSVDMKKYDARVDKFLHETYGIICNGDASRKVCDLIYNVIERN